MRTRSKQIISFALVFSMVLSLLYGCGKTPGTTNDNDVEQTMDSSIPRATLSMNWEDYIGDVETFVYGLVMNELSWRYDVFPASVRLQNGVVVSGIGYVDYEECYQNEDESMCIFYAGFIPGVGEVEIPQEDFDEGLIISDLDFVDETTAFLMKYQSAPISRHCVVYNEYVKYGINDKGTLYYEKQDFSKDIVDESVGSLYSYDEMRYLYDDADGFTYISGESLGGTIDFEALQETINEILQTQDTNFSNIDIESSIYIAQEAVDNYLLSLQEESFLGYDVDDLINLANELDPKECYMITSEGLMTIDLKNSTGEEVARWLVASACVITVAVGMVGSIVFAECPALSAAAGAITGTAIEMFMQVVIQNQTVSDMDWGKVAIAAVSGAVSGFCGPYVAAKYSKAAYFLVDSALDGLVGGAEQTVFAWMDGKSGKDMVKSFGYGFALGFGMSATFKGIGAVAGKISTKAAPAIKKFSEKTFPKLTKKVSKLSDGIVASLGKLKAVADGSTFHSEYISKKLSFKKLYEIAENGDPSLKKKAFDKLSVDDIVDGDGNKLTKESLKKIFDSADDDTVIAYFKKGDNLIQIKKQNGMVGVEFDAKYTSVELKNGLKPDRDDNFEKALGEFKKKWQADPESMPKEISEALKRKGLELDDATAKDLKVIVQDGSNGWVLHENIDMRTITLVPRELHGDVRHMGGCALAQYVKEHMGSIYFERFVSAAASGAVLAYPVEE